MTPALAEAIDAPAILARVRARLEHAGDLGGLARIDNMSRDELDLLVLLEAGLDPGYRGTP